MTGNNKRQLRVNFINKLLLFLFSIVTVLGSYNPFGNGDIEAEGNNSSSIALAIQGCFIAALFFIKGSNKFLNKEVKILMGFLIVWVLSSIIGGMDDIGRPFVINVIKLIFCVVLFYKLPQLFIRNRKLLIYSMLIFSITCSIIALLFTLGLLEDSVVWSKGRAYIFNENPNSTSTRMLYAFIFIMYVTFQNPLRWKSIRFVLLPMSFPLLFAIMASGSRGSFLVLMACVFLYFLLMPSKTVVKKAVLITISSCLIVYFIVRISQSEDFSLMERLTDSIEKNEDAGRTRLSEAAISIFLDNPVIGVGSVEFPKIMASKYDLYLTVHNLYWYIAATCGFAGLILFCVFLFRMIKETWSARKRSPIAVVLLFGMLLIASKTGGALTYIVMWYVFALSYSLSIVNRKLL